MRLIEGKDTYMSSGKQTNKQQQNNHRLKQRFRTRILPKRSLGTEWHSAFPLIVSCCVQQKSFSIFLNKCDFKKKKIPLEYNLKPETICATTHIEMKRFIFAMCF